jgi:uncharacterized membrane protein YccC
VAVPAGALLNLRRRLRAGWVDLAAAARSSHPAERMRLAERFLDRMGLVAPMLAAAPPGDQVSAVATMQDLRIGINLVDLHTLQPDMPPALRGAVDAVLAAAAAHFDAQIARDTALAPPPDMLRDIDRALDDVRLLDGPVARRTVRALVGLRCNMFPAAPAYRVPQDVPAEQAA